MKRERIVDRTARGESIASDKPTFYDASLSGIMQLLRNEAKSGGPSGAFYAEHLAHVLAARLFILMNGGLSVKESPACWRPAPPYFGSDHRADRG
jgi:hypothetical protein